MEATQINFGIVDKKFLSQSVGALNPPEPILVSEDDSIKHTLSVLKDNKIGCVVVTDTQGKVVGIFSERDVILKVTLSDIDIENSSISDVMTKSPHTEQMTTTIAFTLNMMSEGGYRHVPIVDDENYPVGMISVKNIIDYIVRGLNKSLVEFV
jgi:CBS domain-containing protein